jgi:hypothetical protein
MLRGHAFAVSAPLCLEPCTHRFSQTLHEMAGMNPQRFSMFLHENYGEFYTDLDDMVKKPPKCCGSSVVARVSVCVRAFVCVYIHT